MKRNKNHVLELCRFVAALVILWHHSYLLGKRELFVGGWIFVEFFFMITGYFTARHFCEGGNREGSVSPGTAIRYTYLKVLRLVPYAWCGILLGFLSHVIKRGISIEALLALPYNMLFLAGSTLPLGLPNYNPPLWFVMMMLLFLPPIIVAITTHAQTYRKVLCWCVPLLFTSYNVVVMGRVAVWEPCPSLFLRGAADLMLGTYIYFLVTRMRSLRVADPFVRAMGCMGPISFGLLCWLAIFSPTGMLRHSVLFLCLAFATAFFLLTSNMAHVGSDVFYRFCLHLGALSMPLFCLHHPIERLTQLVVPELPYQPKLLIATLASLALSKGLMFAWSHAHNRQDRHANVD